MKNPSFSHQASFSYSLLVILSPRHQVFFSSHLPSLPVIQSPQSPSHLVIPVTQSSSLLVSKVSQSPCHPSHPVIQSPRLPSLPSLPVSQSSSLPSLPVTLSSQSPSHPVSSSPKSPRHHFISLMTNFIVRSFCLYITQIYRMLYISTSTSSISINVPHYCSIIISSTARI